MLGRFIPLYLILFILFAHAGDAFLGKWLLDEGKTKAAGAHIVSLETEVTDSRAKVVYFTVTAEGKPAKWTVQANLGGSVNGVINVPGFDAVRCWRSDARTLLLKLSREGEMIGWETLELSKNGKSLRLTETLVDDKGKETQTVSLFNRE
jgi:hypothetical protein